MTVSNPSFSNQIFTVTSLALLNDRADWVRFLVSGLGANVNLVIQQRGGKPTTYLTSVIE
jgi:hypothetical protein